MHNFQICSNFGVQTVKIFLAVKYLKYVRILLAVISVLAVTYLFVDLSGGNSAFRLDFMARIQIVPALLALNLVAIVSLVALTLIFGRIYCSVICPLGVFQDFVSWLRRRFSPRIRRKIGLFKFKPANTRLRLIILSAFVIIVLLGLLNVMAISLGAFIEPYSAFGRMVSAFVAPVYDVGNNYLAEQAAIAGTYEYLPVHRAVPLTLALVAGVTFVVVATLAWKGGRTYCNSICPVGTLLGYLSRFSWLKIRIDTNRCNSCGKCQRHCKAMCIDSKNHFIDYTRCVDCFDCVGACSQSALQFRPLRKGEKVKPAAATMAGGDVDKRKRAFLSSMGIITGVALAKGIETVVGKVIDGGLTPLKDRHEPQRATRIVPPGAISQAHINAHCVGCQLCVQACPNGLLKMSTDASTFMQPVLSYADGYCPTDCTRCSNVCPAGVFTPLDTALKSSWKVGTAVVDPTLCLSANGTDHCGNCARHCPAGAIEMVDLASEGNSRYPDIDFAKCVGCGACAATCHFDALTMTDGKPQLNNGNCIGCGACARACGFDAIVMTNGVTARKLPVVAENVCIGCGECEFYCPVGIVATMEADQAAIHVEGVTPQRKL